MPTQSTSPQSRPDLQLEIAHLLLIDIVGYSKLLVNEQIEAVQELNFVARNTECFRTAEAKGKLIRIPTGDGMILLFFRNPEEPVRCALEIAEKLNLNGKVQVRMGIHSGPVNTVKDVNDNLNVAGTGINIAQRVMDCGDSGHILLSKHIADDLGQYRHWQPHLHDLGEYEVKHGLRLQIVNLCKEHLGNPERPTKLRRRRSLRGDESIRSSEVHPAARKRVTFAALLVLLIIGVVIASVVTRRYPKSTTTITDKVVVPEKSIAVLPFENRSEEKANAYFADGVQDEILTRLSKISDLKVISRTSTQHYKTAPENLREIARQLGVAHIVEGSVQKSGEIVRINVQLINATTDSHIWADTFDRKLTDILSVETDIAKAIADQLQAKLTGQEEQVITAKPTNSATAYLTYLEAQNTLAQAHSASDLEQAINMYKQALRLDPTFALAFARLANAEGTLYQATNDPKLLERARSAVAEAMRLQPTLPEAHLSLGYLFYRGERNYESALRELEIAKAGLPNEAEIFLVIGSIERRQGKWQQSTTHLEKATALDPNDASYWMNLAINYEALGNFSSAIKAFDRGGKVDPNFFLNRYFRARLDIELKGDTSALAQLLSKTLETTDSDGRIALARFELEILKHRYDKALHAIRSSNVDQFLALRGGGLFPKTFLMGRAYRLLNDQSRAHACFQEAKRKMEDAVRDQPLDPSRHMILGEIYAGLGLKAEAIHEGQRAVQLLPESEDALDGPVLSVALARIYEIVGDSDSAIELLAHSRSLPRGISPFMLRLDPAWDTLRNDIRFQNLLVNNVERKEISQKSK